MRPARTSWVSSSSTASSPAMASASRAISRAPSAALAIGARAGAGLGGGGMALCSLRRDRAARLLMGDEGAIDVIGKADAASLGESLGVLLGQERAPDAHPDTAAERAFAIDGGEHVLKHLIEEHRLEVLGGLLGAGVARAAGAAQHGGRIVVARDRFSD